MRDWSQRRRCWVVAAATLAISACGGASRAGDFSLTWHRSAGSVALRNGDATVWEFRHGEDVSKPMFHPVSLVDGTVLTWDRPPDHPWHHAFWFCWKYLNGVNYWEEDEDGRSKGITEWRNVIADTRPDHSAHISMDLSYHTPGQPPVMNERREIEISAPATDGSYRFDWTLAFTALAGEVMIDRTPITGEPEGKPWGGYAGLSIRFAKDLTDWRAVSSDGEVQRDHSVPFHAEQGPVALDFTGSVRGREAGIALLDHPENLNAPTPWYIVMNQEKSFGFSEAAVVYYKPHRMRAGERLTLRYRAVVHEGRWNPTRLRAARVEFVKEASDNQ